MSAISESFLREIKVYKIEFCHDKSYGVLLHSDSIYAMEKNKLVWLLGKNKPVGMELLWKIEQLFLHPHSQNPAIDLVEMFGVPQIFTAQFIKFRTPVFFDESYPIIFDIE